MVQQGVGYSEYTFSSSEFYDSPTEKHAEINQTTGKSEWPTRPLSNCQQWYPGSKTNINPNKTRVKVETTPRNCRTKPGPLVSPRFPLISWPRVSKVSETGRSLSRQKHQVQGLCAERRVYRSDGAVHSIAQVKQPKRALHFIETMHGHVGTRRLGRYWRRSCLLADLK